MFKKVIDRDLPKNDKWSEKSSKKVLCDCFFLASMLIIQYNNKCFWFWETYRLFIKKLQQTTGGQMKISKKNSKCAYFKVVYVFFASMVAIVVFYNYPQNHPDNFNQNLDFQAR